MRTGFTLGLLIVFFLVGGTGAPAQVHYLVAAGEQNSIREYDENWNYLGDFVGSVRSPEQMAYGPDGHLYVASLRAHEVYRFDGVTGEPMGVAGFGTGQRQSAWIAFDPDGSLVISWFENGGVTRHDPDTGRFLGNVINPTAAAKPTGHLRYEVDGEVYRLVSAYSVDKVMRFREDGRRKATF